MIHTRSLTAFHAARLAFSALACTVLAGFGLAGFGLAGSPLAGFGLAGFGLAPQAQAGPQAAAPSAAAPQAAAQQPLRHARAADGGARLRNVPDKSGVQIMDLSARSLLAVWAERAGWLSVEPPQGLEVWVFGQYLAGSDSPGLAEVTGNNVNMRPRPSSEIDSYPLEQQLTRGQRLRVLARQDATKPLESDWVKVVAPPGTRAWVLATETVATEAGADPRAEWNEAVKSAQAARPTVSLGAARTATTPAQAAALSPDDERATGRYQSAEQLYNQAKAAPEGGDWKAVREAYEAYLKASPSGVSAAGARARIDEVAIREEIARLMADRQMLAEQRTGALADAQQRLLDASLFQDPNWGRFQARGWFERQSVPGQEQPVWVLRWAGKTVAEVVCSSGRYDLTVFESSEIGVRGITLRAALGEAGTTSARPVRLDATRIEVLSARLD